MVTLLFFIIVIVMKCTWFGDSRTQANSFENISVLRTAKLQFVSKIANVSRLPVTLPKLSHVKLNEGCKMGFDTWAYTSCVGKHAHVLEWIDGHTVTAEGFTGNLGKLENLPIANVAYVYDTSDGVTVI